MKRKFRLANESVKANVMDFIKELECDGSCEIIIAPYKARRTLDQNARMHKLLHMMGDYLGYSIEEIKLQMKSRFLEPKAKISVGKGQFFVVYKSTSEMNVKELSEFMEHVEDFAAMEVGITLPPII